LHRTKELEERQGWIAGLASPPQPRLCEQGLEEDWYSRSGARPTLSDALAIFLRQAFDPLSPIYDIILLDCPSHLSPLARARLSLASALVAPTIADPVSNWERSSFPVGREIHRPRSAQPQLRADHAFPRHKVCVRRRFRRVQDLSEGPRVWPDTSRMRSRFAFHRSRGVRQLRYFPRQYAGVTNDVRCLAGPFSDFMNQYTGATWTRSWD